MVGGAKLHLETDLIPSREAQRTQTNLLHTRIQGPQRDLNTTLSVSCGGKGQNWPATGAGVLGAADLVMAYALLEEVAINPTTESPELTQTGETDSWRAETEPCVHQDPAERSTDPQETDPDLPTSV